MISGYTYSPSIQAFENKTINTNNTACSICLDSFTNKGMEVVQSPCHETHLFHAPCLESWLSTRIENRTISTCPTCRLEIGHIKNSLNQINTKVREETKEAAGRNMLRQAKEPGLSLESQWRHLQYALDCGVQEAKLLLGKLYIELAKEPGLSLESQRCRLQHALDCGVQEAKLLLGKLCIELAKESGPSLESQKRE